MGDGRSRAFPEPLDAGVEDEVDVGNEDCDGEDDRNDEADDCASDGGDAEALHERNHEAGAH